MSLKACERCGSTRYAIQHGKAWPGAKLGPATGRKCDDCGHVTPIAGRGQR